MKNFKYITFLIGLVICFQSITHDQTNSFQDLDFIEKKSNYRVTLALSILAIIGYYNHQKIISSYKIYPFSSLILSYLTGTLLVDVYTEYKTIDKNLSLLKAINQIYLYLKSALLIEPDTEKCFKLIEKHSLFSINEIEKIIQNISFNSLKCLNCTSTSEITFQCPDIHQLTCHEMDLCKIIAELENDSEIYNDLISLKKDNFINKDKIFEKIGKKINQKINFLIKNKNFK